jgi:hypothetical protein
MKRFLLIYFLMVANILAQGSRPPVTTLSGLTDVFISSPANGQGLIWNSGTSRWNNTTLPSSALSTLTDVTITSPASKQLLSYDTGTSHWINYGPLAFTDITGNIAVTQLNSGTGASATTYWRGDGAWGSPPVGGIPVTSNVLVGDNSGNALPSTVLFTNNVSSLVQQITSVTTGDGAFKIYNVAPTGGATSSLMLSGATLDPGATFRYYEGAYPTTGMIQNTDASLTSSFGRLLISGKNNILFATDGGLLATERARLGSGLMVGTTIDKGGGTTNVTGGYYLNGNKVGGVATVLANVDQTSTSETVHVTFTVPGNSAVVGTVYHIHASGNIDNPTSLVTFTPKIRWGGTGGVDFLGLNVVAFTASTTANSNRPYVMDARVTIRTIGASGTAMCEYSYTETSTNTAILAVTHVGNSGSSAGTIDTTTNKDLVLTWSLNTATGTPHIRTFTGNVEVIQP